MAECGLLRLSGTASDLGDEQVDTKWCVLVLQICLQLGNLLAQHVWGIAHAANDAETASVGDGGCEFGTCGYVHTGEHDGVIDLEEVGDRGAELLCGGVLDGLF